MQDFRPDCIINLHVSTRAGKRGQGARRAWSCSIVHPRHGRLVCAQKLLGEASRETAERAALLFGMRQAARLLQEKVELAATFPLGERLGQPKNPRRAAASDLEWEEVARTWEKFRLGRVARMGAEEAKFLAAAAEQALERKRG